MTGLSSERRIVALAIELASSRRGTFILRALARCDDGTSVDVTGEPNTLWSSSNPSVLALRETMPGVVGAGIQGGGTIAVVVGDHRAECAIDNWDGVLTRLRPPRVESGGEPLITGLAYPLDVPLDSSPTNSYDGHELHVTVQPPDAAEIVQWPPVWYVRPLRAGRFVVRSEYGTVRAESELEAADGEVVLGAIHLDGAIPSKWFDMPRDTKLRPSVSLHSSTGVPLSARFNIRWSSNSSLLAIESKHLDDVKVVGLGGGRATLTAECLNAKSTLSISMAGDINRDPM